jgi:putative CocE/NonD family hydrolase
MRDGIDLAANVFRPEGTARLPAILIRTPYGKGSELRPNYRAFVEHGYAVVIEDVRGRYKSEGFFDPLRQEVADGEDTLSWIAHQEWSNRRVGMTGASYLGIAQWKAALSASPYLKAIFPIVAGCDDYFDRFYSRGGALKLGHRLEWIAENLRAPAFKPDFDRFVLEMPLRYTDRLATGHSVDFFQQALDHPAYDAFWKSISTRGELDRVRVPVFAAAGWYDNFAESDLEAFSILRRKGRVCRLIVGPWPHDLFYHFGNVDFGPDSRAPLRKLQLDWFDTWLQPPASAHEAAARDAAASEPPLRIFVMGANRWRDEREWPLARAVVTPFFLAGHGKAITLAGDGRLEPQRPHRGTPDRFVYDPADPVPTAGGNVCCNPMRMPWGPRDQREIERRRDVLVYTSAPLKRPLEVTGPVRVILYVSTSAPDTDFTAKVVDVSPDGSAINLCDGILRLRYRDSIERPALARPGQVYPIAIDAGVTSNEFAPGHRIRLEVSSSNFPHYDRNPNTGRAVADEKEMRRTRQTVYHDRSRPSQLLLPVIPESAAPPAAIARRPVPSPSPAAPREVPSTALRPPGGHPF